MNERKICTIIISICHALYLTNALYFHESSSVKIRTHGVESNTDFGFAMAYESQNKTLVVGAPRANFIGKVYDCDMEQASYMEDIGCDESVIEIDPTDYNVDTFPNQHFYMGSSIVASSNWYFTCAPLWTVDIYIKSWRNTISDAYGTCFIQNDNNSTKRYYGILETHLKYRKNNKIPPRDYNNFNLFTGGTGWSTLLDEENNLLIIVKTSLQGDFLYLNTQSPYSRVKSLKLNSKNSFNRNNIGYHNIGFGITAGKFFSNKKGQTFYAFSKEKKTMNGVISFLEYDDDSEILSEVMNRNNKPLMIEDKAVGAMFGATLASANLNSDGYDELLAGAPAQSDEECVECGAVHIYIGGDMYTINEMNRLRTILGSTEFARFGTAITVKDLDGDKIPELIVSAPYENKGRGAVYILSGFELISTLLKYQDHRTVQVSELKLTQRIQKETFRTLGFSLQFVDDVDANGCNELAVGSPGASRVLLFKCMQNIRVTLSSALIGDQLVRDQDTSFTIEVCAQVKIENTLKNITGNVTVTNSITGGPAEIPEPNISIDISCTLCKGDRKNLCKNVTVELKDKDPADYIFTSKAELQNNDMINNTVFNNTWVVASRNSVMEIKLPVSRHCKGDDCIPKLSVQLLWSGSENYTLGSSANETATIKVTNDGNASYGDCVNLYVRGAPLKQVGCDSNNDGFVCDLISPLRRGAQQLIYLMLNMTTPTSIETSLQIEVYLLRNCKDIVDETILIVPYILPTDEITFSGSSHKLNITDKQILENATVYDDHEFVIRNNGTILWKDVNVTITVENKPYIATYNLSSMDGCQQDTEAHASVIRYYCIVDLLPNSTKTITGTIEILTKEISPYFKDGIINTNTKGHLSLDPEVPDLSTETTTKITFLKEILFSNNKLLISLLAAFLALILLAILIFVLYKCGFFRRKQKQQLLIIKESIRKKSVRRNTHVSSALDGPSEGLQMEVDEDSPFDDARPVSDKDGIISETK